MTPSDAAASWPADWGKPPTWATLPTVTGSLGLEVGDVCRLAEFGPDPEQEAILHYVFGRNAGRCAAFEVGVIAPRQNLKTGALKQVALGNLFVRRDSLTVWSAHKFATAQEAFREMVVLIESTPALNRRIERIWRGNGDEAIELKPVAGEKTGPRLMFKARTKTGLRGLAVPRLLLDEGFALDDAEIGTLMPTLAALPDPQVIIASSAGFVTSGPLRELRDRGRRGDQPHAFYAEWGDPNPGKCGREDCDHTIGTEGCALDDPQRLAIGPAVGRRISLERLAYLRRMMSPDEFAREFLGWWDEPSSSAEVMTAEVWLAAQTESEPADPLTAAVDVAPNHAWSSVFVCGSNGVLERVDRRRGSSWLPDRLAELGRRHGIAEFAVDPAGPVGSLIPDLERAGVTLRLLDGRDTVDACGAFVVAIRDLAVKHRGEAELTAAVAGASRRAVGDGWKWSRKDSTVDISPLVAATYAYWCRVAELGAPIEPTLAFV